jgi:aryl-alcohol dehydrogenase-like predicted oxidoreductase
MKTRRIGSLEVSVVGLGCNNFGGRLDAGATAAVVETALDAGITLFDTADIYGGTRSEEFLGKALGARRDGIVLATKFGMAAAAAGVRGGASFAYVKSACEDSLRRLGTDRIDLYQLHRPDPNVPIAETLGALGDLVREGKVIEIGCSNFTVAQLREAAAVPGAPRFASVQNELSLLHRGGQDEVLAECAHTNTAFVPFFPLAGGALTGKYLGAGATTARGRLASGGHLADEYRSAANVALTERLAAFADARGRSLVELAVSWLLAHAPVASVIAGATTGEQVRANVAAAGWALADDDAARAELARLLDAA